MTEIKYPWDTVSPLHEVLISYRTDEVWRDETCFILYNYLFVTGVLKVYNKKYFIFLIMTMSFRIPWFIFAPQAYRRIPLIRLSNGKTFCNILKISEGAYPNPKIT